MNGIRAKCEDIAEALSALLREQREDGASYEDAEASAHAFLMQKLHTVSPGTPVLSRENAAGYTERRPERYWLLYPLDDEQEGAGRYVASFALIRHGAPVAAVIMLPDEGVMYSAAAREGAYRNGKKLPKRVFRRGETPVLAGKEKEPAGAAADLYISCGCSSYIRCRSTALTLALIAEGSADVFVCETPVHDCAAAAGALALTETGGAVTLADGTPYLYDGSFVKPGLVAAASPALAKQSAYKEAPRAAASPLTRLVRALATRPGFTARRTGKRD